MKKAGLLLMFVLVAVAVCGLSQSVNARPQYNKEHLEKYKESPIADEVDALKSKCSVCHYGTSKKNRNDYGKTLEKLGMTREKFDELKTDADALSEHVKETLEKVLKEKNEDGETYADRIKAGKLPGTNPPEEE